MKNLVILILITILMVILSIQKASAAEHTMMCVNVGEVYRCENKEAICYKSLTINGGIHCRFKKDKDATISNTTATK